MTTIDPTRRWSAIGEKPEYAGLTTFASLPYTEDPSDLHGVDAAIVGAPMDELTVDRPGARLGPRAIRAVGLEPGRHLEAGIDALSELRVVDFGDAPIVPGDPLRSHAAIEATVSEVVQAGALPVVLGGDHSIAEPDVRACAAMHGPLGLIHFDAHTDTASVNMGSERNHGTAMFRLVRDGKIDPTRYAQIGLRGYWPGENELAWQRERGITSVFMHDIRVRGLAAVIEDAIAVVGPGPAFLSVDVDVLDPAFAPGTGTPEPGGMTSGELLWACRQVGAGGCLVGIEVVEVAPEMIGSRDITALVADRVVREALTGVAARWQTPRRTALRAAERV
jgi:agmatinase